MGDFALPVVVYLAEMCVVTCGTLRIIFVSRGQKLLAPCLGFFEIIIWLFAISQVMRHLDDPRCFLAFAAGFTTGNFLGICIEKRLAMGLAQVSVVTPGDAGGLVSALRACDFGVTTIEGSGAAGPVQIVFTVVRRKQLGAVIRLVEETQPGAFYAIDEVTTASQGIFPARVERAFSAPSALKRWLRFAENARQRTPPAGTTAEPDERSSTYSLAKR